MPKEVREHRDWYTLKVRVKTRYHEAVIDEENIEKHLKQALGDDELQVSSIEFGLVE